MKILIIDNYDSFTFNLFQYVGEIFVKKNQPFVLDVIRNNQITENEINNRKYDKIIISPGPGNPSSPIYFGVCAKILTEIGKITPVLGVCLGMQGMAYYFGGKIIRAHQPMHGKTSLIKHDGLGIFKNLPQNLEVMRYHSLIAEKSSLPKSLKITALSEDSNEIMGLRHKVYPIEGIQFHPESFATEGGKSMLANFLFNDQ